MSGSRTYRIPLGRRAEVPGVADRALTGVCDDDLFAAAVVGVDTVSPLVDETDDVLECVCVP